jgi:Tol biopolymer transport system component
VWVDQRGNEQLVTEKLAAYFAPRLSPDGRRIAYVTVGGEGLVYVYDLARGTNGPLTGEGIAIRPIWAPDGKRLLFGWKKSLAFNLFWQLYDGSSPMERLTTSVYEQWPGSWSPDGKTVALVEVHPDTGNDIAVLDVPSGRVTPFLNSQFGEAFPDFSPNGGWMAYTSNESKREEVYVRAFPGPGMKQLVSSDGGGEPLWARNGKQLFYRRRQGQVWVVDVRTDGGFAMSKPRLLFEKQGYAFGNPIRGYDLSLDSQRFLMVKEEKRKPSPATEMILVQNWFEELKRLVPTGKK